MLYPKDMLMTAVPPNPKRKQLESKPGRLTGAPRRKTIHLRSVLRVGDAGDADHQPAAGGGLPRHIISGQPHSTGSRDRDGTFAGETATSRCPSWAFPPCRLGGA